MKNKTLQSIIILCFLHLSNVTSIVNAQNIPSIPDTYKPVNKKIYKSGYIDFNKNGRMDIYENPNADIEERIADLLSQMNLDEKTCQIDRKSTRLNSSH